MRRGCILIAASFLFLSSAEANTRDLLDQARQSNPRRMSYAESANAEINATEGSKSFYVYWTPKNFPANGAVIVTLHGHGSWAFDEFYLWKNIAEKRNMGVLALQWWLGRGEETSDYLTPDEIYSEINRVLRRKKIRPGKVILHGYSRGSTNTYAVTALDRSEGGKFIKGVIANAGAANLDYFPTKMVDLGMKGEKVYEGVDWVMYCGGKDPNPDRDGCPGMLRTKAWVEKRGGRVIYFIRDMTADHGGFQKNPRRVEEALSKFVI